MQRETAYDTPAAGPVGVDHEYGDHVHVLSDVYALSRLARLCSPDCVQPEFNAIVQELYRHLLTAVLNTVFPTERIESPTRMAADHPGGVYAGAVLDRDTRVVCVDVARAGILPSQVCFDMCSAIFRPENVRHDHVVMSRVTDATGKVTGADINGSKIGGPIDGRYVLFPDPMGATGGSLAMAMDHYREHHGDAPAAVIAMNLIITPQFIRTLQNRHPGVQLFALRVDRGASDADVLTERLGARWDAESGLTDIDYIVPGGGGFGELINNSFV